MSEQEIEELRERWEAGKSPALTLELAERYLRRDESSSALEVLEAGLGAAPDDLDVRLAKGRCHLDLDQPEAARGELRRVVLSDPAHLQANRLLAEVHARLGEPARARDRLEFFALLSDDPQAAAELARRLAEPAAPAAGEEAIEEPIEGATAEGPAAAAEPFELPTADAPRGLEMDAEGPTFPGRSASDHATIRIEVLPDDEPFDVRVDESSYRAALFGEGLFSIPASTAGAGATPAPVERPQESAAPTLTLAALYRKQGHHEEAAGILRQILARQPGNREAARALTDLQKELGWPLTADDLLGGAGDPNPPRGGRTADRLLKRYRERLRGEA